MSNKRKKKIGIVGSLSRGVFGVPKEYMQYASIFGDVEILTPDTPVRDLDLLILRGGADITPVGQNSIGYSNGAGNPYLDLFYEGQLSEYVINKTPIFGICRGLQEINLFFGGSLKQHIHGHPTNEPDKRSELVHDVINPKGHVMGVNSLHHQAIDELGDNLQCIARSGTKESIIEAIMHKTLPIRAVQWHPEEIYDKFSIDLIEEIIN